MKTMRFPPLLQVLGVTVSLLTVIVHVGFAQYGTSNTNANPIIPIVTVVATMPRATWSGEPGVFTVYRTGDPTPALNVYCCIDGTASNGVDYQSIGNFLSLPSGVMSNNVIVKPINRGQTNVETVTLDLCPSSLMIPVNYEIGTPSNAVVYITPTNITNLPPVVNLVSPTNGSIFHAPTDISLIARASDPDGTVTNVE